MRPSSPLQNELLDFVLFVVGASDSAGRAQQLGQGIHALAPVAASHQ
jgi:hypothetical protein